MTVHGIPMIPQLKPLIKTVKQLDDTVWVAPIQYIHSSSTLTLLWFNIVTKSDPNNISVWW